MMEGPPRRRLAALLVLVFAGAASIATSPPPPEVATRPLDHKESFELTAETPIAVRRVAVQLNSEESLPSLEASLVARLEGSFDPDSVRLSVVPDQPGNQHVVSMPDPPQAAHGTSFFAYDRGYPERASCPELPCARTYRMIAELLEDGPGGDPPAPVAVTLRVAGEVSLTDATEVPASVTFTVEPVGELERLASVGEVASASDAEEVEIGGPDRLGSEIHAVLTLAPDTLPPTVVWPVVPEVVLRLEGAERGRPTAASGQLSVTIHEPGGSTSGRQQSVYFYASELPIAISLQTIGGCAGGVACTIPIAAELGAQSPGELVPVTWSIEARARYFDGVAVPEGAGMTIAVIATADRRAERLEQCARQPILVLIKAAERQLISEEELLDGLDRIDQGTFDPATLEELPGYEDLCFAAIDDEAGALATSTPPPSERDPAAPRVEAVLPAEPITLSIDTPLFVRDVRLTRNAAAAGANVLPSVGYLRINTTAPESEPERILDATIRIVRLEDGQELVPRSHVTSTRLSGWSPDEFDPWVGCDAGAACTVDIRIVLAWWHYEPDARFPVTWDLRAGMAWPGAPAGPEGAAVAVELLSAFDTATDAPARTSRLPGPEIVLAADGQRETRTVTFRLGEGAWPPELAGMPIPGHALLGVSSSGAGTGDEPVIGVDIKPPGPQDRGVGDIVELDGEKAWSFAPFAFCNGRAPCEIQYTITFERTGRGGTYGPITVEWSIESVLRTFTTYALPPGSEVIIDIAG
jgi:hypothetical protein